MPTAQIAPSSDEYVLDQLSTSEEKLLKLLEELDGKDLNETLRQMEEEEVRLPGWSEGGVEWMKMWSGFFFCPPFRIGKCGGRKEGGV